MTMNDDSVHMKAENDGGDDDERKQGTKALNNGD
eukprot:CAMPEP_0172498732 /NCGR_PEP_ID=MMETSP1066-20121228/116687_1 /TAXON_ID=671091 /ORGANISM="Coscinodiscus wailesii, Strain CCMP2513" /LENGTH=33 /DNA_ID= /DNA_START= /DNA_END= /DNA_ORIENTATION=